MLCTQISVRKKYYWHPAGHLTQLHYYCLVTQTFTGCNNMLAYMELLGASVFVNKNYIFIPSQLKGISTSSNTVTSEESLADLETIY